ncbi:hypothetical protein RJ640_029955 [Escallonia rubra]|uniref:Uncharacterized protein n=1 Tax=Escallonia rubra TaxID=112253 RepID=A0AA88R8Y7_9ASTE|nr:hypothetical protein RJ640_029955 [Escallonia rubra]
MLALFCYPFDVLLIVYYLQSVLCFVFQENRTTKGYDFFVDVYDINDGDDERDNSPDGLFDYICALCDNNGQLLCCEGMCIRSFHATVDAGAESFCESLGFTDAQVEAMPSFLCKNCQYQQHQCFACGMLGSSSESSGAEVLILFDFSANLVHRLCSQSAIYHYQEFALENNYEKNIQQRAWGGLLPNRILIYCTEHDIIPEIGTPARDYILFPDDDGKKKRKIPGLHLSKEKVMTGKRSKLLGNFGEKTTVKMQKNVGTCGDIRSGHSTIEKGKFIKDNSTYVPAKVHNSSIMDKAQFARNQPSVPLLRKEPYLLKSKQQHVPMVKTKNMLAAPNVIKKASSTRPSVDAEMENR